MSKDRCEYCGEKLIKGYDFIEGRDYFVQHSHYKEKEEDADEMYKKELEKLKEDQRKAREKFPDRCPKCDCHLEEDDRIDEDTIECFVCGYHVNRIKDEYGDPFE